MSPRFVGRTEARAADAALALGTLGPAATLAIPSLVRASSGDSWTVATRAKAALLKIRGESVSSIDAALNDTSNLTNWLAAASTLAALGSNTTANTTAFLEALSKKDLQTKFSLIDFFCTQHVEPAVAVPILVGCLNDKEPGVRVNTMNALIINSPLFRGRLVNEALTREIQAAVASRLSDTNRSVCLNALAVLSMFANEQSLSATVPGLQQGLTQASNDPDPGIRSLAASIQRTMKAAPMNAHEP